MTTIKLKLNDEAVEIIQRALDEHDEGYSVQEYLEYEINNNADVLVEMLLSDY